MFSISTYLQQSGHLLAFLLGAVAPVPAQQTEEFVVIVHASNQMDALSTEAISKIFLKREIRWGSGDPIFPVDMSASVDLRERFDRAVHGRSSRAIAAHWQQQVFSGRDVPPPQQSTDAAIIAFVASNPHAIGYVSRRATLPATVKAVQINP